MRTQILIWLCLPVLAAGSGRSTPSARQLIAALEERYGPGAAESKIYVGSEACLACHQDKGGYRSSLHATGLKMVLDDGRSLETKHGIIVDYDRNGVDDFRQGLDFNKISSAFDPYKPNAPVLKYAAGRGYLMQIGPVDYRVMVAHGGSGLYKQRFLVKLPVTDRPGGLSAGMYYTPVQYNEPTREYVVYSPTYWYGADRQPRIRGPISSVEAGRIGKSFDKDCSGCHATSAVVAKDSLGEYVAVTPPVVYARPEDPHYLDLNGDNMKESFNIGCERCHGPGNLHIMSLGDKKKIIQPGRDFTAMQANQLCGSCHSRGTSKPAGIHEFPYDEAAGQDYGAALGEDLYARHFIDKPGLWPDKGESRQHHQQFQDFMRSAKWEFPFHKVTCFECHDVHEDSKHNLRSSMTVDGSGGGKLKIATRVEDNTLCLACHAGFGPFAALKREQIADYQANAGTIAGVVQAHTHHKYDPEGGIGLSRCTECHMANFATSGASYDISTHSFKAVPPERTLETKAAGGMPNSCALRCHRPMAPLLGLPVDANQTNWAEPSDEALAQYLKGYYGPEGVWWKTKPQEQH